MEKINVNYTDAPKKGDWVLVHNHNDNSYGFDLTEKIETNEDNHLVFYGKFGTVCLVCDVNKVDVDYVA